jgi:hypothetical protein
LQQASARHWHFELASGGLGLFLALALVPVVVVAYVLWLAPMGGLAADRGAVAARDFTSMWAAGHLLFEGHLGALFDRASYNAELRTLFGAGFPGQVWSYPPPGLLLSAAVAALPVLVAFALWTGTTLAGLWVALRGGGFPPQAAALVMISPAVADNALAGQNGALVAALLVGGLLLADRRPAIAGALLGALIIKPQFGVLVPVCLLASRNGGAFCFAALSAGALSVLAGVLFGFGTWIDFFTRTQPALAAVLREPWQGLPGQRIFASPLMAARSLGAGLALAEAVQLVATLAAGVLAWRAWRRPGADARLRTALTVALAMLAAPWTHSYDMAALAAAIVILYPAAPRGALPLLGFAWFWPGAAVLLPMPMPLEVASIAGLAWLAWGLGHVQQPRQHQAEPGHECDQQQADRQDRQVGQHVPGDLLRGGAADCGGDEEAHPDRRRESAEPHRDHQHDAVLERRNAEGGAHRQQQRAEDQERRQAFQERAHRHQGHDRGQHEQRPGAVQQAEQFDDPLRYPGNRQRP